MKLSLPLLKAAAAAAALAAGATGAAAAPTLQFAPGVIYAAAGDTFTLLLQGSGFDMTAGGGLINNISGGQKVDLGFTPVVLELLTVDINPRWRFAAANKTGVIDNANGSVTGMGFGSFPATTDDAFDIATFTFRTFGAGSAYINVSSAEMVGRVGGVSGQVIPAGLANIAVTINPVPEPATWALFAVGLAGAAAWTRRRQPGA